MLALKSFPSWLQSFGMNMGRTSVLLSDIDAKGKGCQTR
jgi:hypothetical protein